jgi:hypothetical protein
MNKENKFRPIVPATILFILLNGLFITGKTMLKKWNADQEVLIVGNLILFVVTLLSYFISLRGLKSSNPNAMVRSVYGSFMVKFFVCIIAAFIYIMAVKKNVNKPALFACMALYLVYAFIEVSVLTKLSKQKKNA